MKGGLSGERRGVCALVGMSVAFRAFYAVIADGAPMYGSRWLAVLGGTVLSLIPVGITVFLRRRNPACSAEDALKQSVGRWGTGFIGALFFLILTYDAAAVLRLMSSSAKYVAMPEGNNALIMAVTAVCAVIAAGMGTEAAANAALLWKKAAWVLIVLLLVVQIRQFRAAWLMPILGAGTAVIAEEVIPPAGMFSFAAAGWLLMSPEHDKHGTALFRTVIRSGLTAAGLAAAFCMLVPGMIDEMPMRSFRLGRLLANDRAGLSLEMPYVILLYGGMLTMLVFEISASAKALQIIFPKIKSTWCVYAVGALAYGCAAAGWVERETVRMLSQWYYPLIGAAMLTAGVCALRKRKEVSA